MILSRRAFFFGAASVVGAAALKPALLCSTAPLPVLPPDLQFHEVVTKTLQTHADMLIKNLSMNNALLQRLQTGRAFAA